MDEFEMASQVARMMALRERQEMQLEALYNVIEEKRAQVEGYYALRLINNLSATISIGTSLEDILQNLENLSATIDTQIARFDAMATA